jgi:hypothetical protein
MNKIKILISFVFLFGLVCNSQIESGKTLPKNKELKKKKLKPNDTLSSNFLFLSYSYGNAFRNFKITDEFFNNKYEKKLSEKMVQTSNFQLELKSPINKNLYTNIGIVNQNYGETYESIGDTSFSYLIKYHNFAIPFKLGVEFGNKFKVSISSGFQAQMLSSYRRIETLQYANSKEILTFKSDSDLRPLTLAFLSSFSFSYNFNSIALSISGEYLKQLNSTYLNQKPYNHKPYFYGLRVGIGFRLS